MITLYNSNFNRLYKYHLAPIQMNRHGKHEAFKREKVRVFANNLDKNNGDEKAKSLNKRPWFDKDDLAKVSIIISVATVVINGVFYLTSKESGDFNALRDRQLSISLDLNKEVRSRYEQYGEILENNRRLIEKQLIMEGEIKELNNKIKTK